MYDVLSCTDLDKSTEPNFIHELIMFELNHNKTLDYHTQYGITLLDCKNKSTIIIGKYAVLYIRMDVSMSLSIKSV